MCQATVETVLTGCVLRPLPEIFDGALTPIFDESSDVMRSNASNIGKSMYWQFRSFMHDLIAKNRKPDMDVNAGRISVTLKRKRDAMMSFGLGESKVTNFGSSYGPKKTLLNLFV